MNELSAILNNLNKFTTAELEVLVQKFPYFQQGHLLLAKKYQQEGNSKFDQQLQLAALYTRDRELLYDLFKSSDTPLSEFIPTPQVDESAIPEITPLEEFPVSDEQPLIEKEVEIIEEPVFTPLIPEEEFQTKETEQPAKDSSSSYINDLIIEIEDTPEEIEEERPSVKEREAVDEYTLTPLVFGDEEKPKAIDEAPKIEEQEIDETLVKEEEPLEMPVTQEEEQALAPVIEQKEETPEPFAFNQAHSFDDWLKVYAQSSVRPPEPEIKREEIEEPEIDKNEVELDRLIATNQPDYLHQLVKEETNYSPSLAKFIEQQIQKHKHTEPKKPVNQTDLDADLITETMAKIYEMQKKYDKAIHAYEVLGLKFPEKSGLFAARIHYLNSLL